MKDISDYFGSPESKHSGETSRELKDQNVSKKKKEKADPAVKDNSDENPNKSKLNAFQLLMDSRNNIIGQNSSGKKLEPEEESPDKREERAKLDSRKNLLENWAEQKGASKRKRQELEIDKRINVILEKRAKKLKKMLHLNENSEEINKRVKKHKRTRKLSSTDSESSNGSKFDETTNRNVPLIEILEENALDCDTLTGDERDSLKQTNFCGIVKDNKKNDNKITKAKKKSSKSSLDSFCGVEIDESSQESQTPRRKWKMKIRLNRNDEEDTLRINEHSHSNAATSYEEILLIDSDEENSIIEVKKLAPIFHKADSKLKVDKRFEEAKKQFLFSGIPDALKKNVDRQKSFDEKNYDVFPAVSHVQQKCDHKFWNLPKGILDLPDTRNMDIDTSALYCNNLIVRCSNEVKLTEYVQKVKQLKSVLNKIKLENPDYPVFKAFRQIYERSGKQNNNTKNGRKQSGRRSRKSTESSESTTAPSKDNEMWTEKYKPRTSEDIFGNNKSVTTLRSFLETWMKYSNEINFYKRLRKANSDSESEFESTDCDSRDGLNLPGNTIVVVGPCGSGKTSAIYALANEFGFNVLEINASSKRTGKRLIQELHEATQSHQVRKNGVSALLKAKKSEIESKDETKRKKMCILLVEDIDLVFEQDEGFLTSLGQLIATSKRPIILTTSDTSPAHVQKLLNQHEFVSFSPFSLATLSVWLQIVCLVEGLAVDRGEVGSLLEYNKGDIRKTLLQLQFWVQSGGQLNRDDKVLSFINDCMSTDNVVKDEELNLKLEDDTNEEESFVHRNLMASFEIFCNYNVPYCVNLGLLWWNTANLLSLPDVSGCRLDKNSYKQLDHKDVISKAKLGSVLNFYESMVITDLLYASQKHSDTLEPVLTNWSTHLKDSFELNERMDTAQPIDFTLDISHTLINGSLEIYKKFSDGEFRINMALPNSIERRWRAKQHLCEDFLKDAVSLSSSLDRTSVALDYLPALRAVTRSEEIRASANTKRGNRFRHYLKNFNVSYKDSMCKTAARILEDL